MPDKKSAESEKSSPEKSSEGQTDAPQTAPEVPRGLLKKLSSQKSDISDPPTESEGGPAGAGSLPLDDNDTNKAVDDIVAQESDTVLAVEDAARERRNKAVVQQGTGWKAQLRALAKNKWTWIGLVTVLIILFAVPLTRYKILGLVIKRPVTLVVIDSKTKTPVSNAQVVLGGVTSKTDANGKAHLKAPVGTDTLKITKQYYTTAQTTYFVGFRSVADTKAALVATGRLVPVRVFNKITGQLLKGAEIQVLKTTAKTDAKGLATIALPAGDTRDNAKIKLDGYNQANVSIEVTDKPVKTNNFELTPAGHIYFLSNQGGTLDVVKTNLDGSDRHVVLEGTGKEDKFTTSLLASRDWRYLVLKARRDSDKASLYLIDTSNDKVTQFDNGNAEFSLIGWYGHSFLYDLTRNTMSNWQVGREGIKSYDAEHLQLNQLDQNQAEGDATSYSQQSFANFYIVNGALTYTTRWYVYTAAYTTPDYTGKNDTIRSISPTGQNKKDYQSFPTASIGSIEAVLYKPQNLYYSVYSNSDNKSLYYEYEDGDVKAATDVDQNSFNQGYPTYLLSPSGNQNFWTELRDGKNSLFIGDANAKNQKQIANLSDYAPYGWFSDAYTLVSKNSSELYIMPSSPTSGKLPVKITDYYKPAQTFTGYGYGYGGL